jgi:branched-chain amino acid transport system permease protein
VSAAASSSADAASAARINHPAARALIERHRLRWWEALPWIAAIGGYFAFPGYLGFGTELLVAILFALSLDLALGYAGIITLGHAAFFGAGAYTVSCSPPWRRPLSASSPDLCCCAPAASRCSC